MSIELPKPIADYFAADADKADRTVVARCFTVDAVARDDGRTYVGRDAIQQWKQASAAKFSYTSTPFSCVDEGDRTVVTSHLVGNFPGSPLDLRYLFKLEGDKIAVLEIKS